MSNRNLYIGLGAAALLAYLWNRFRPLTATVTTSEIYDTDDVSAGSTSYSDAIKEFARAVARAEGYGIPNAIPTAARNPGDLKLGGDWPVYPGTQISVFPSVDLGWSKLYRQLYLILSGQSAYYTLDHSIREMGLIYAGGDPNWSRNVAEYLGVSEDTKLWAVLA